jgi:hypothetical protein
LSKPSERQDLEDLKRRYLALRGRFLDPATQPLHEFMKRSPKLARLGLGDAFFVLAAHWPVFAGPVLGAQTYPVSLKKGELRVRVNSPLLRQELTYASPSLLRVARDHFGEGIVIAVRAVL